MRPPPQRTTQTNMQPTITHIGNRRANVPELWMIGLWKIHCRISVTPITHLSNTATLSMAKSASLSRHMSLPFGKFVKTLLVLAPPRCKASTSKPLIGVAAGISNNSYIPFEVQADTTPSSTTASDLISAQVFASDVVAAESAKTARDVVPVVSSVIVPVCKIPITLVRSPV